MKKNARDEGDVEQINQWKGAMKDMYEGLQEQNNLEDMAVEMRAPQEKSKKGFFSKMNDKISSAVHQGHSMNSNVLKKKK